MMTFYFIQVTSYLDLFLWLYHLIERIKENMFFFLMTSISSFGFSLPIFFHCDKKNFLFWKEKIIFFVTHFSNLVTKIFQYLLYYLFVQYSAKYCRFLFQQLVSVSSLYIITLSFKLVELTVPPKFPLTAFFFPTANAHIS